MGKDKKKKEKPKNPFSNIQPRTVTMAPAVVGYKGPGVTIDLKTKKRVNPPKLLGVGKLPGKIKPLTAAK